MLAGTASVKEAATTTVLLPLLSAQQLEEQSIGVVFADEIYEAIPYDRWDAILPVILTERGIFHAHQQG